MEYARIAQETRPPVALHGFRHHIDQLKIEAVASSELYPYCESNRCALRRPELHVRLESHTIIYQNSLVESSDPKALALLNA